MSQRSKIFVGLALLLLLPVAAFAATNYLENVATTIKNVVGTLLPAFIGLAIIGFAYGIFVYLKSGAEDKEQGKNMIVWGGLAVVVLISLYGLAYLLQTLTGATGDVTIPKTHTS